MIEGVKVIPLRQIVDERGKIMHMLKATDPHFIEFGEIYFSCAWPGAVKAWHIHKLQTDWLYVVSGALKIVLYDTRTDSPTNTVLMEVLAGDIYPAKVVKIPAGVAHGYKVIEGPAHVLYITSRTYDPSDEGRIPHDDPSIGYDWTANAAIN